MQLAQKGSINFAKIVFAADQGVPNNTKPAHFQRNKNLHFIINTTELFDTKTKEQFLTGSNVTNESQRPIFNRVKL